MKYSVGHGLSYLAVLCLLLGTADPAEVDVIDLPLGGGFQISIHLLNIADKRLWHCLAKLKN